MLGEGGMRSPKVNIFLMKQSIKRKLLLKDNLVSLHGCKCYYCGSNEQINNLTVDHIYPKSLGGNLSIGNTVLACRSCNMQKGARVMSIEEFKKIRQSPTATFIEEMSLLPKVAPKPIVKTLRPDKPIAQKIYGPKEVEFVKKVWTLDRWVKSILTFKKIGI